MFASRKSPLGVFDGCFHFSEDIKFLIEQKVGLHQNMHAITGLSTISIGLLVCRWSVCLSVPLSV